MGTKTTKFTKFSNQKKKEGACWVPNPNGEILKRRRIGTWHVWNKNPTRFYYKKKTKTKQGYAKITYLKLMLNKLKVMGNFTFIYWALNLRKIFKKLSTYMCPMSTHVYPCVNYERIKIQLKMNWKLIKN
jgi:hypothetical protein